MAEFRLATDLNPAGDQPQAIEELTRGLAAGVTHQVLLGATGTGKTVTVANAIQRAGLPTLVLSHNKTLAAQLYGELKELFPGAAVEYFVSYYDYYQPEAYIASSDTYIQKDSLINEHIDKLRHRATRALLERDDVIIVSSVSCIYGIGSREAYDGMLLTLEPGQRVERREILARLVDLLYERNETDFHRGTFRARGDVIEIFPVSEEDRAIRVELFGDEVERLTLIDPLRGRSTEDLGRVCIYPASHYVTPPEQRERALGAIRGELQHRLQDLRDDSRLLEAQRLEERTCFDLEMMEELGHCKGIENYSRHLTGRSQGEPPPTLLEYFPSRWLLVVDESHVTIPQVRGMYKGDRSRKENLVRYGFRLPSALDNRPLTFEEFERSVRQVIYVSATPADHELERAGGVVVEQIIRPTGLLDPEIEVREATHQVDDLLGELRAAAECGERVLVTVLTKRMAQELTDYYRELGVRARYLHSDIDTLERMRIVMELRQGEFDVLVGINLLREGLDLPEVALVAVLEADKEGFLRNRTSLIQTVGRAARNVRGRVILYGNRVTASMEQAMEETRRRREVQLAYNARHGIDPESIQKEIRSPLASLWKTADPGEAGSLAGRAGGSSESEELTLARLPGVLGRLRKEMKAAASRLEFERAADLRDRIHGLERWAVEDLGEIPTG
jgi:excinuclease ABC subunit B